MFLSQSFSVPKPSSLSEEVSIGRCNTDGSRSSNSKNQYVVKLPPIEKSKNIYKDGVNKSLKLHIAYQGVPGAYSEAAAMKVFPDCDTVPSQQFEDAIKAAELWRADRAVIPIENSLGGSVHRNYDLLVRHTLHIVGETHLAVDHCLLALPGVKKEDLNCVFSHPQALDQCEMSIKCLGIVRITSTDNTAGAAKMVASDRVRENGAIASARAAEIYSLDILAHKFQDAYENVTRFLILAREPITFTDNTRKYKTSVVFTLKEGHGAVVEALAVFALRSINLCKIESRPLEKHSLSKLVNGHKYKSNMYFDYCFFIDFEASVAEPRTQYALEHLQEFTNFLRILGCYPLDNNKAVPT